MRSLNEKIFQPHHNVIKDNKLSHEFNRVMICVRLNEKYKNI